MHLKKLLLLLFPVFLILHFQANAQLKDSIISVGMINANYSLGVPAGDLEDRFGISSDIGVGFLYKFGNNMLIGGNLGFIFGGNVKEDTIFRDIIHLNNIFYGSAGLSSNVVLLERGFSFYVRVGQLFPLFGPNPNSGLLLTAGAGFLQHKIRIQVNKDFQDNELPQLDNDQKKGYDRLSNGFSLNQFVGYMHLDNRKLMNFFIGFDISEAFTKNRRSWNFDTMEKDNTNRLDILYGFRVGWILPLYRKRVQEIYYY